MTTPDLFRKRATEAVVSLYRRSQHAGDEGRIFIIRRIDPMMEAMQIGLIRTNDEAMIASIHQWRTLFNEDIRELEESEILALFEAA